jgi:acetyl-CoA carboxylase biotin carboxylase subunit
VFKKILIANRGEIAVRVIRACRELGVSTVAVFSEADRDCLHVKLADEAICIGPGPNRDSYLNIPNIISAALLSGSQAIHPGYGNLSETASFAENCEACKIAFIGPSAETMRAVQDKAATKHVMKQAGVPVIPPQDESPVGSVSQAAKLAKRIGYPVAIKASSGGGGRGIRIAYNEEELQTFMPVAQSEAQAAFDNNQVYLEKYLEEPRHVEFQILANGRGNILHLGDRDCSLQTSRHQKLLEETPCIALSTKLRSQMGEAAIRAAKAVGYKGAGTVEFLLDKEGKFYFLELNARIQVEHTITEMVTGIDLVKEQIRIAAGDKLTLTQKDIQPTGHAIECRITAEDPDRAFLASAGVIEEYIPPGGPGIRVDSHLYCGYEVPPFYDSLLAKVVAWGRDRKEAIARMSRALAEFRLVGVKNTIPFHRKVLENPFFKRGEVYTTFIARRMQMDV